MEQIKKRMEQIKEIRFVLSMKDNWSEEDYSYDAQLLNEYLELKNQLTN